jgi:hypothetical protein
MLVSRQVRQLLQGCAVPYVALHTKARHDSSVPMTYFSTAISINFSQRMENPGLANRPD